MKSKQARLDRFLSSRLGISRRNLKPVLASGRVTVDGIIAFDAQQIINEFSHITCDGEVLQNQQPVYIMMNKPAGVVSATKDDQHQTVIDLLEQPDADELHIVGRLDLNTSGLLLLTNDGRWSRQLTQPESKVSKRYIVTLAKPLNDEYIDAFARGMYFGYEDITTRPATLKILSEQVAEVTLEEGRYHQIKRMFGRLRNQVMALHRLSIGNLSLDAELLPGQSRELTEQDVRNLIYSSFRCGD